jgi:hypothetical protein
LPRTTDRLNIRLRIPRGLYRLTAQRSTSKADRYNWKSQHPFPEIVFPAEQRKSSSVCAPARSGSVVNFRQLIQIMHDDNIFAAKREEVPEFCTGR